MRQFKIGQLYIRNFTRYDGKGGYFEIYRCIYDNKIKMYFTNDKDYYFRQKDIITTNACDDWVEISEELAQEKAEIYKAQWL